MPLAERRERWQAMYDYLVSNDVFAWRTRYLDALTQETPRAAA
jgi:trehalose-6-phosphate synthase